MRRLAAALLAFGTWSASGAAVADVPPDPTSIAAHCTPAEQCPSGFECERSVNPSEDRRRAYESCVEKARGKGFQQRCGAGATHGYDLFCPPGEKGTWSPPGATDGSGAKSGGCAVGAPADGPIGSLLLLTLAVGLAARRRR